ncbi:uncharacterized protein LOC132601784 [Lycium barbarum]|uniref:uncharacterized protein LOC132601784 n=1 Tax=Lycium barbarum TaxID=112863 RepID=UPI00293E0229|nr:uncharacterized protein LOC132601784 [Lycium barbarum]
MDTLPDCLIHKRWSYLSVEEAAKTRILSKTIAYGKGNNNSKIVDKVMERYRDRNIPIERFALSISTSAYHHHLAFPRIAKRLGIALQNGVKDVVCEVSIPLYPFPISTFLASKSLRELYLTGCDLMGLSLSTIQAANCHSLRKLSLTNVRLDDNLRQTLLNYCPLIIDLIIVGCRLLTKIELRNLQNIKSISISIGYNDQNQSVKIQAPTLEHFFYSMRCCGEPPVLDITECHNLKSLKLSDMKISQGFLRHLISTYQFLESLILDGICGDLEWLNICGSQSLKFLRIHHYEGIWEVDASNLVSLEYEGDKIPEFKIAKESGQMQNSKAGLYCSNDINAAWFCELRKFLSNLTSWYKVFLHFNECNEINMKDLQVHHSVATPQVDVLDVFIEDMSSECWCPSFVDALLWSCHPRRLNLCSSSKMVTCFMNRLMYMKNSSHSTSHGSKPWHTQLKEVKAYKFDSEYQPVELSSGELAVRTLMEVEEVYFLLDW